MSTISVALSRLLAESHREKQQHYLAAPVFGRPDAATAGKPVHCGRWTSRMDLNAADLFSRRPAEDIHGRRGTSRCQRDQVGRQFPHYDSSRSLGEAFAFGRKFGIDAHVFLDVLTNSLFSAPIYKNYGGMIASDKFEPAGFKLPLGFKDNRLLLAAAEEAAVRCRWRA